MVFIVDGFPLFCYSLFSSEVACHISNSGRRMCCVRIHGIMLLYDTVSNATVKSTAIQIFQFDPVDSFRFS